MSEVIEKCLSKSWVDFHEYRIIKKHYGDRKAKRSGELLIKHITEGCDMMSKLGASDNAIKAFMLHPIYQSDSDYLRNYTRLLSGADTSMEVLLLVLEYRKVANAYLCKSYTDYWTSRDIEESTPLTSVDLALMLWADKNQNYSDFLKHHKGTHPRSKQLEVYFESWLERLKSYFIDRGFRV